MLCAVIFSLSFHVVVTVCVAARGGRFWHNISEQNYFFDKKFAFDKSADVVKITPYSH